MTLDYTDEEYCALGEILHREVSSQPESGGLEYLSTLAKEWLKSYDNQFQEYLLRTLKDPLEDMGLLINDEVFTQRVIAEWRLKIGR